MSLRTSWVLLYLTLLHLSGIYLFTRGFLLSRLSLASTTTCDPASHIPCTLPPTHKRAVLLVVDALRFDFISPHPPEPHSPYHHNVITLPRELTLKHPRNSFLFNTHADPPTATLQRIKGLVTGSLPTFVDAGHNFGGSSIMEDSIVQQLRAANKSIAFMGDDTWMTVFPDSFGPNITHPFDSFNVEDLHTVDNGVIYNLLPLLSDSPHAKSWDFLIGHFLGVDHVGHRVGPDHPSMKAKQEQMNDVFQRVVDLLDKDTLLIVLGDHGMDRRGDHGGDSDLEVSAGMWVYSKGHALSVYTERIPVSVQQTATFPGETLPHRWIQQIDLVPTLSLLLGLPIPFNNLGTVIPELFWRDKNGKDYAKALEINAKQVNDYLAAYRASGSGSELDAAWVPLQASYAKVQESHAGAKLQATIEYTRFALETCRSLWAQFNVGLMGFGLTTLFLGVFAGWGIYIRSAELVGWDTWAAALGTKVALSAAAGTGVAGVAYMPSQAFALFRGISILQFLLFGASASSALAVVAAAPPKIQFSWSTLTLVLHSLAFLSNSYTFWEDRAVPFFLLTSLVPALLTAFSAPTARLRHRILFFTTTFAVCVRLMAMSSVCREEQQPWCSVTFFAGATVAEPPKLVIALAIPTCLVLPYIAKRLLSISKSDNGIAAIFIPYIFAPSLLGGTAYWLLEWVDSSHVLGAGVDLRLARTLVAWCAMCAIVVAGGVLWTLVPVCLQIVTERVPNGPGEHDHKTQVIVLGFANAFGSPYFIFWCIAFGAVWLTTQLTGQIALGLASVALLAHLELVDSMRDATAVLDAFETNPTAALELLQSQSDAASGAPSTILSKVKFDEVAPLALLALHTFYTTGHQSTLSSIQWKTAFVLTSTVTYPLSPLLVALNNFGPVFLFALAVPLLALWNVAPVRLTSSGQPAPSSPVPAVMLGAVRAGVGAMAYFSVLLVGSAVSAAWLRRHLMVWKVFAPRYMFGAAELVLVDLAVLFGVLVGVGRVTTRIRNMFQEKIR
ncbi:hypothetical protein FA95DRAFT_1557935 [Auriscalpium vulgare]|uniref:Uncharacterized protein n=1 Tax=Auriscalpium vulgare TaxID=40419 RepID=A0ACB8RX16_9AGAM|nr:hypothetical protein FA95DRAFT_1557935 [Auriscalpium vulgare]